MLLGEGGWGEIPLVHLLLHCQVTLGCDLPQHRLQELHVHGSTVS